MRQHCFQFRPRPGILLVLATAAVASTYMACSSSRTFRAEAGGGTGGTGGTGGDLPTQQAGAENETGGRGGTAGSPGESHNESGAGGGAVVVGEAGTSAVGGPEPCMVARDCTPPDALLCGRACVDGVCEFTPAGAAFSTGPDTGDHRTSGFDAAGTPYVFWGDSEALPSSIVLQRLQNDGAPAGVSTSYLLPSGTDNLRTFDATFDDDKLGLIWNAQLPSTAEIVTQFDVTSVGAGPSAPTTLAKSQINTKYPQNAYTQLASPGDSGWLLAEFYGTFPATWRATWLDPAAPPSAPPFVENPSPLTLPPVCSDQGRVAQTAAVVGSTLYLSGFRCDWYQLTECPVTSILARYDRNTLEPLDPPQLELTVNPVPYEPGLPVRAPVLGPLSDKVAVFWSEMSASTPTPTALGRALFNADGSVAKSRSVETSTLVPKAYVALSEDRGLLLASRVDDSVAPPLHRLQAQLVDDELEWLGDAFSVDDAREEEPSDVQASIAPDGNRVLVTFRQGRARHRLLHASLCQ